MVYWYQMAMNIKNPEAQRLAQQLAKKFGRIQCVIGHADTVAGGSDTPAGPLEPPVALIRAPHNGNCAIAVAHD